MVTALHPYLEVHQAGHRARVQLTGHFVKTGGPELADELEENGYDQYLPEGADSESCTGLSP